MQASSTEFHADALNTERRVVLQLREGFGLKHAKNNKIHAAFEVFNVAKNVASFSPLPHFELKGELLEAFEEYILEGKQLSTGDRYALSRVTIIGDGFFINCNDLKTIDLSPLSNVTTVGDKFLCGCFGLSSIDLTPLSEVTTIGDFFLAGCRCTDLKTIDLTPLSNVTTVGEWFLYYCKGLSTIDLTPLSNLRTVGRSFLCACSDIVDAQGEMFISRRGRK